MVIRGQISTLSKSQKVRVSHFGCQLLISLESILTILALRVVNEYLETGQTVSYFFSIVDSTIYVHIHVAPSRKSLGQQFILMPFVPPYTLFRGPTAWGGHGLSSVSRH